MYPELAEYLKPDHSESVTGIVRPCVIFDRIVNKDEKRDKVHVAKDALGREVSRHVTQTAARRELWPCYLANPKGELFTWATMLGMQQYIAKGWTPVELKGFEEYFARKASGDMVDELRVMYEMLSASVKRTRELAELISERDALREELKAALAGSNDPKVAARIAELEAHSKERDELKQNMATLQQKLLEKGKELEDERKIRRDKEAREKK